MQLVIIGNKMGGILQKEVQARVDNIEVVNYKSVKEFLKAMTLRGVSPDELYRMWLCEDILTKDSAHDTEMLGQLYMYLDVNYRSTKVIGITKEDYGFDIFNKVFTSTLNTTVRVNTLDSETLKCLISKPLDVVNKVCGGGTKSKKISSVIKRSGGKTPEKKQEKKEKSIKNKRVKKTKEVTKKENRSWFSRRGKLEVTPTEGETGVEEQVEESEGVTEGVGMPVEQAENTDETEGVEVGIDEVPVEVSEGGTVVDDESEGTGGAVEGNESSLKDTDSEDEGIESNVKDPDTEDEGIESNIEDTESNSNHIDTNFDHIFDIDLDTEVESDIALDSLKSGLSDITGKIQSFGVGAEGDAGSDTFESEMGVPNYNLLDIDTGYDAATTKVVERVVERVVTKDGGNYQTTVAQVLELKQGVLVVTGDRRSGKTDLVDKLATEIGKRGKVLVVDLSQGFSGLAIKFGLDNVMNFEENRQAGLAHLRNGVDVEYLIMRGGGVSYPVLLNVGEKVDDESLSEKLELLIMQRKYDVVIIDTPLEYLKHFGNLVAVRELGVIVNVEGNASSAITTSVLLDELGLDTVHTTVLQDKIVYRKTRGDRELRSVFKEVAGFFDCGGWLDQSRVVQIG